VAIHQHLRNIPHNLNPLAQQPRARQAHILCGCGWLLKRSKDRTAVALLERSQPGSHPHLRPRGQPLRRQRQLAQHRIAVLRTVQDKAKTVTKEPLCPKQIPVGQFARQIRGAGIGCAKRAQPSHQQSTHLASPPTLVKEGQQTRAPALPNQHTSTIPSPKHSLILELIQGSLRHTHTIPRRLGLQSCNPRAQRPYLSLQALDAGSVLGEGNLCCLSQRSGLLPHRHSLTAPRRSFTPQNLQFLQQNCKHLPVAPRPRRSTSSWLDLL